MHLKEIMMKYGEELGIPEGIPSNRDGAYELPITDALTIFVRQIDQGTELRCNLGDLPLQREANLLYEFMGANLLGISTRGAVLGLSADSKQILLSLELPEEISHPSFMERFEDFCNVAETWFNAAKA